MSTTAHDKVNLGLLVRKLQAAAPRDAERPPATYQEWLKTQSTLQKIKFARKLLKGVEEYEQLHSAQ
jgi:hypothetical protein